MNKKKRNMTELGPLSLLPARQFDLPAHDVLKLLGETRVEPRRLRID